MGVYRLDLASTGRAVCKNKECKDNQVKIPKGSLRFCTQFEVKEHQSWAYKHWGCVTPVQIQNLKESIEDNLDYLDGYDEIGPELQAKVSKALEEGHIDDADWFGDPEQNRPGSRGKRTQASKKKQKPENSEAQAKDGSPIPSQPATKKRGRGKKINVDEDDDGPPPKKSKAASTKGRTIKAENDDADADELPPTTVTTSKKAKKVVAGDAEGGSEAEGSKPKQNRKKRAKAEAKQKVELVECKEEVSDGDTAPPSLAKNKQPIKKAAASQKIKSEEGETHSGSDAFEDKPKAKKVRKPANTASDVKKPKKAAGRAARTRNV